MERANETNIHPGIILQEDVIAAHKLSIGAAAALLGVSRLTVSKIANGRGAITPNMALRIEKVFGVDADFWLRMQGGYDLMTERNKFSKNPPQLPRFIIGHN